MEDTTATTTYTAELRTIEGATLQTWETDGESTAQEELEGYIDNQDASEQRNLQRMDLELVLTKSVDGEGWGDDVSTVSTHVRDATPIHITIVADVRNDLSTADQLPRAQYDNPDEPYYVDPELDVDGEREHEIELLAHEVVDRYFARYVEEAKREGERLGFEVEVESYNAGSNNGTTTYVSEEHSDETWELIIGQDAHQAIGQTEVEDMASAAFAEMLKS